MSTSVATPADESVVRTPLASRRARIALVGLAVIVVLVAGTFGVIHAVDAAALGQARVFLDTRSLSCADPADVTTLIRGSSQFSADESYAVPAVRGTADLDCRLSVVVQNNSDRTLEIQRVTFDLLGPQSAVGLHTDYAFTQGLHPAPGGDRTDVVYDYANDPDSRAPFPVPAGGTQRFSFHLRSDACRQAGASTTWNDSPTFTATVGTDTQNIPLESPGFGFIGAKATKQPCH